METQNPQTPPPASVPPPVTPPVTSGQDNDKNMAMIAYILFFVPLLAVKNRSTFLNFHTNQGLALFIVAVVGSLIIGFLGWRLYFLSNVWNLLMIVLVIIGIMNVSKNESKPLPIIGNWFKIIK